MVKKITTYAFVQARLGSARLKNKVLKKIKNKSLIELLLKRLEKSKLIDKIIVLIPKNKSENKLDKLIKKKGFEVFRGSGENVLDRFYKASKKYKSDYIIRITADCPLIDVTIVDNLIKIIKKKKIDYVSNINPPSYPDGLDAEVFNIKTLEYAWKKAKTKYDKEHVTPFIVRSKSKKKFNLKCNEDLSGVRLTVDYIEDFQLIEQIFDYFSPNIHFKWKKIIELKKNKKEWFQKNKDYERNEVQKNIR